MHYEELEFSLHDQLVLVFFMLSLILIDSMDSLYYFGLSRYFLYPCVKNLYVILQ